MNLETYKKNVDKLLDEAVAKLPGRAYSRTSYYNPENMISISSTYEELATNLKELVTLYNSENGIK